MGRLDGKVVLISGAARGQGAAEAGLFVEEGARVVLGDVLDEEGDEVAGRLGDAAIYRHLDVRRPEDWAAATAAAVARFGTLTTLVNNAGVLRFGGLADTSPDAFREVVEVNQVGCFLGMRAVAPLLIANGGGAIVNVSSTAGMVGLGNMMAYTASKWAIRGMTKAAAVELAQHGVRVNAIMPGSVRTEMLTRTVGDIAPGAPMASVPLGRAAEPEEMARLVLFLVSDESSYSTGQEFVADGGVLAGFLMRVLDSERPPDAAAR